MEKYEKMKKGKPIISAFIFVFISCLVLYFMDYHITVKGVLNSTSVLNKNSIYLGRVDKKSYCVFFYDNTDTYETIIVRRRAFLLKSNCSFWSNKTNNLIETTGGCSIGDLTSGLTAIPIICKDKNVSYITINADGDEITKNVSTNEIVIFTWNRGIARADITGEAYAENGKILYVINSKKYDNQGKNWITWSNVSYNKSEVDFCK